MKRQSLDKPTNKTCGRGHRFFKSSDCPFCPICERERKPKDRFLSLMAAPARRALEGKGIISLEELSNYSKVEIVELHGIGPSSIPKLENLLKERGLSFKMQKNRDEKPNNTQEYIESFPGNTQKLLTQIRLTIIKAAPEAEEVISYGMPGYKLGSMLVFFAAYPNHIGFYPTPSGIEKFKKELSKYKGAKGSVQFPLDEPLPLALVTKIVKFRVKENMEKATLKKAK